VLETKNVKFYYLIRRISYLKFFPIDIEKNVTDLVKKNNNIDINENIELKGE